jgi:biopolymer transport protein ExbD
MAGQERILDVWLVDLNEVYSGVPFTVVADWLQQGRLLGEDRVRLAGNQKWHTISAVPAFAPYLPRPEPLAAEDQAEALEPVELGLDYRRPHEEDDEDVDMIPLIDISLVLLIFFMMTAAVTSGVLSPIQTPAARHQLAAITSDTYWLGIDVQGHGKREKGEDGKDLPWYSLGVEHKETVEPTTDLEGILTALEKQLQSIQGEVKIRLRAERSLSYDVLRDVIEELQGLENKLNRQRDKGQRLSFFVQGEVSEPQQ